MHVQHNFELTYFAQIKFSKVKFYISCFEVNIKIRKVLHNHGGNTIGTTCVVDRDDTAYMVVDREFRLPTE